MIQRSPEIEAIVRRWTTLIRTHKVADLPHYLSQSDALVYIGSAAGELWRGQLVRDGIADHLAEVPDFIEEEGAAFAGGDTAQMISQGAGEGPLDMAEQFALKEGFHQGAAVHCDKRLSCARRQIVHALGGQILSGAGFAFY